MTIVITNPFSPLFFGLILTSKIYLVIEMFSATREDLFAQHSLILDE